MSQNYVETVRALAEWERNRKGIIEKIIYDLRNEGPTAECPSALEERIGDLAGLVEMDATVQGIFQEFIRIEADLADETDRCEALFSEYALS